MKGLFQKPEKGEKPGEVKAPNELNQMDSGEGSAPPGEDAPYEGPMNAKERLYEKIRLPLPVLDRLIWILVAVLIVAVLLGMLEGRRG